MRAQILGRFIRTYTSYCDSLILIQTCIHTYIHTEVKATVHKTNMTASKAKVNATATTHMKAIKMDRDTFLDRLQEVLGCSIKKIDYCNPVYHRTAEQCDFTDDCDECDDVEGCHWSTKDKLCVPDCDDCDDELIDKHQEPNYLEDSVPAHVVDDFGPEDCEDIDYRVECEHHTCCQWVAGDDDEDEDDHCAPHPDADQVCALIKDE